MPSQAEAPAAPSQVRQLQANVKEQARDLAAAQAAAAELRGHLDEAIAARHGAERHVRDLEQRLSDATAASARAEQDMDRRQEVRKHCLRPRPVRGTSSTCYLSHDQ